MVRLQKFLADAGVGSRRASEQIILAGRVVVNGQAARVLGVEDYVHLDLGYERYFRSNDLTVNIATCGFGLSF